MPYVELVELRISDQFLVVEQPKNTAFFLFCVIEGL